MWRKIYRTIASGQSKLLKILYSFLCLSCQCLYLGIILPFNPSYFSFFLNHLLFQIGILLEYRLIPTFPVLLLLLGWLKPNLIAFKSLTVASHLTFHHVQLLLKKWHITLKSYLIFTLLINFILKQLGLLITLLQQILHVLVLDYSAIQLRFEFLNELILFVELGPKLLFENFGLLLMLDLQILELVHPLIQLEFEIFCVEIFLLELWFKEFDAVNFVLGVLNGAFTWRNIRQAWG